VEKTIKVGRFLAIIIVAVVMIATCVIIYTQSSSVRFKKQFNLGTKYLSKLDYDQAIVSFEKAIEIEPDNVDAYLGLADAYIGKGMTDKAIEILRSGYDKTGDDRLLKKMNSLQPTDNKSVDIPVKKDASDNVAEIKEQFSDLITFMDDYYNSGTYYSMGCGDWKAIYVTTDEANEAFSPLISEMEEYLKYKEEHDISYKIDEEVFGRSISKYDLRELYIITHQFDKSAKLEIQGGVSSDGYTDEYDEYCRETYFETPDGDSHSFVWGDDGSVSSFTSVYMNGENYPVGTVEEYVFGYDNGKIVSMHITQTIPSNEMNYSAGVYEVDAVYIYDDDTVTLSFVGGNSYTYERDKYGRGKEVSSSN